MAKMSKERREYLKEFKKENLKRIPLEVNYDFYIKILQTSGLMNKSVNGFIKEAIAKAIEDYERGTEAVESDEKIARVRNLLKSINENNS